ncbi:MAG TPA: ABC transporter ATP-binding protein [Thermodesulfobacteriota bacterium]
MPAPILRLEQVTKRFGDHVAVDRLDLAVDRGEFFTFLGSSGSGKSTVLRIVAGLEQPDGGRVLIDSKDMAGVPPWRRHVGMVFQQYAVFPHMNVAANVAYGLGVQGKPRAEIEARVASLLALVGLSGKERRDVTRLSGGEQQRVALARALAPAPSLLLLDEPLGALDEKIRREMQAELKRIQRTTGMTFVYVTHDQEEALTMSDRVAVMHLGSCLQVDAPETLFRRPRTRFTASFFRGSNVVEADLLEARPDALVLRLAGATLVVPTNGRCVAGPRVPVSVRAESLHLDGAAASRGVRLEATLAEVVYRGTNVDHVLETADGQRLTATSTRREVDGVGRRVTVGFDSTDVVVLED